MGIAGLHEGERGKEARVELALDRCTRCFRDTPEIGGNVEGVIDQDIYLAEMLDHLGYRARDSAAVAHVANDARRFAAGAAYFVNDRITARLASDQHRDLGALLGEQQADRATDSSISTRDDCHLAFQFTHATLPFPLRASS